MRKTFVIILLALICLTLPFCRTSQAAESEKLHIVTTTFPPFDFAREIADQAADVSMLLPPGSESHTFEPTPQDIIKIQECDIFIYGGGESDSWADRILASLDTSNMRIIAMTDYVQTVEEEIVEGMQADSKEGEAETDEHVWTSPKNAALIVQAIAEAMIQADTANAAAYKQSSQSYLKKLNALDAAFEETVANAARKTLVFGDRFPFRYLADAYGLEYFAAFPGCAGESEASAQTVVFLIDKVRQENIPAVFHIEFSNELIADAICEETGAKKLLLHSCHNVSPREIKEGASYLSLMSQNVDQLKEALN